MTKKELKELMNLPMTDFGNAKRLQILFGKRWVYLPQYHYWMYRDRHCWTGKRSVYAVCAAASAFRELAEEIYRMPVPKGLWEQSHRVRIISWLMQSSRPTCAKHALNMFRDMQVEEGAVREEEVRG